MVLTGLNLKAHQPFSDLSIYLSTQVSVLKLIKMSGLHQCFCDGCDDNEDAGFSVAVSARVYIFAFRRNEIKSKVIQCIIPQPARQHQTALTCRVVPLVTAGGSSAP